MAHQSSKMVVECGDVGQVACDGALLVLHAVGCLVVGQDHLWFDMRLLACGDGVARGSPLASKARCLAGVHEDVLVAS